MQVGSKTVKQWKLQDLCSCYLFISYSRVNYNFHTFVLFGGIITIIIMVGHNYYKDGKLTLMSQCVVPFSLIIIYCGSNKERLQNKKNLRGVTVLDFFLPTFFDKVQNLFICLRYRTVRQVSTCQNQMFWRFVWRNLDFDVKKNLTNREGVVL